MEKKQYKSLLAIPVKVEMQPVEHASNSVLTIDQLQQQIEEARKGKARVDNEYVNYDALNRGHLFDYKLDYSTFLSNMTHIIKEAKKRREEQPNEVYQNPHQMIIQ